jgi:hypothetical protein
MLAAGLSLKCCPLMTTVLPANPDDGEKPEMFTTASGSSSLQEMAIAMQMRTRAVAREEMRLDGIDEGFIFLVKGKIGKYVF